MANLRTDYEDGELFLPDFLNNTNRRVNTISPQVENLKEQSDGLQNTLAEYMGEHGSTPSGTEAIAITLRAGTGLNSSNAQAAFAELASEVFPLTVEVGSYTDTYEVGSSVTPSIPIDIMRRGVYVDGSADIVTSTGSFDTTNHVLTDNLLNPPIAGSQTYTVTVTQGGQTKVVTPSIYWKHYLYKGVVEANQKPTASNIKAFIEGSWRGSNKVLSNDKSLGNTNLAANKYYLFAVKQSAQGHPVTLIVKNANSGGTIEISSSDKGSDLQITRVNGSGSDYYSWVIVPASPNSWTFKIVNS